VLGISSPHDLAVPIHKNIAMLIDLHCSEERWFLMALTIAGKSPLEIYICKSNNTLSHENELLIPGPFLSDLIISQQNLVRWKDCLPTVCPNVIAVLPSPAALPLWHSAELRPLSSFCGQVRLITVNVTKTCGSPNFWGKFQLSHRYMQ